MLLNVINGIHLTSALYEEACINHFLHFLNILKKTFFTQWYYQNHIVWGVARFDNYKKVLEYT